MIFSHERISAIGNRVYAERMRQYLNEEFPETEEIAPEELERVIIELTEKAACYKLVLETHVAPYIVAAWIMGIDFDESFPEVKEVLEDLDMDSGIKAEWIWHWLEETIDALERRAAEVDLK